MAGQHLILNEVNTAAVAYYAHLSEGPQKDVLWRRIFNIVLVCDSQGTIDTKLSCIFCNTLLTATNPSSGAKSHSGSCKVRMQPPLPLLSCRLLTAIPRGLFASITIMQRCRMFYLLRPAVVCAIRSVVVAAGPWRAGCDRCYQEGAGRAEGRQAGLQRLSAVQTAPRSPAGELQLRLQGAGGRCRGRHQRGPGLLWRRRAQRGPRQWPVSHRFPLAGVVTSSVRVPVSACLSAVCWLTHGEGVACFCRVDLSRGRGLDLGPLPPGLDAAKKRLVDAVQPVLGPPFFEFLGAGSLLLTRTRHGTALLLCCMHTGFHALQHCRWHGS